MSQSPVLYATHASAKGVNCTVCGGEIACASASRAASASSASKITGVSKSRVRVI